jgi:hypothetical protein
VSAQALKRDLVGHQTQTVPEMGWASKKNGELLALAEPEFDVFLTVDRNLSFQQEINRLDIAVVVNSSRREIAIRICSRVPDLLAVLIGISPGQLIRVGA